LLHQTTIERSRTLMYINQGGDWRRHHLRRRWCRSFRDEFPFGRSSPFSPAAGDICDPKPFVWTKSAEGGRSAAKRYGRRRRFSRMPTAPRVIDKHIRRRLRRVGGPDRYRSLSSWARTSSRSAVLGLVLPW